MKNSAFKVKTDITVVIVNYRVKELLAQLLDSLYKTRKGLELQVIVVDNNSGDQAESYLKNKYPDITFIQNDQNRGFSKANNQGIALSESPYTLLINPDTVVLEGMLTTLFDHLESDKECALAGVKMVNKHGGFAPESRRSYLTTWSSFCALFGLHYIFPKSRWFAQRYLGWLDPDQQTQVPVVSGACMFWRTEVLKELGGFDEQFFMYAEDDDICLRLKFTDYHAVYLPEASIIHYKGMSKGADHRRFIRSFTESLYLYFRKHNTILLAPVYRVFIYLAFLIKISAAYLRNNLRSDQF